MDTNRHTQHTHTHMRLRDEGLSAKAGPSTSSPAPPSWVPTSTLLSHVVLSCPRAAWGPWGQGLLLPPCHQHPVLACAGCSMLKISLDPFRQPPPSTPSFTAKQGTKEVGRAQATTRKARQSFQMVCLPSSEAEVVEASRVFVRTKEK